MTEHKDGFPCAAKMWLLALAIGFLLAVFLPSVAGCRGLQALVTGLGFFLIGGALMAWLLCKRDAGATEGGASAEAEAAAEKAAAEKAAEKAAADKAAADAAAAEKATAAAMAADANDYDGDGKDEGSDEGTRPEALTGPRDGGADDLKMIKGIGPKLEKLCNTMGFYHFDQIAAWSADEIAWVNANLEGFKGRVSRDNWVEQAKTLAAGGSTEFANRVKKGDVYD